MIPTYNERGNLEPLMKRVFSLKIPDLEVMIVDDNSPDGTGELAENLARRYPIVVLHREKKLGLGTAYVYAFTTLLVSKKEVQDRPEYIIQMDADLSHDPGDIFQLLEKAKEYDVVLGSRYVPGGAIHNWNWFRKLISRLGNVYARAVLGVPFHDLTSGFKCYRRVVLEGLDLESLSSVGYNFQIETTYKAYRKGWTVTEVPISFTERNTGSSKMNLGIILESFFKVLLLRLGR